MDNTPYRALVLRGKQDAVVERRERTPLRPGQVRVKFAAGGICGSDLHYYHDFGNVGYPLQHPLCMGHEACGSVDDVGPGVTGLQPGDKVAVNPVMPCGVCMPCRRGEANLCENKRFPCSAMIVPHVEGFFREYFETEARCCVPVPADTDMAALAFAEPLSCSLHAVLRAGDLVGKRVLVTGSGPIGILAAAAAKVAGAGRITITDIADQPLEVAERMGADTGVNTAGMDPEAMARAVGPVDAAIEASGAASAIVGAMHALRKGGTLVQLGTAPVTGATVPWVFFTAKELQVRGSSQFTTEFETAVALLLHKRIDPLPMLSGQFPFEEAAEAFAFAGDRTRCVKAQFVSLPSG
ncbi:MAG: alcohol dehydrogenase catalytic domain-containing protein [Planctomycetaceae bacterium]|nr:alcohol dehydrogenase catalytic domain-containing protein [Planctomycetaceae bacterium]